MTTTTLHAQPRTVIGKSVHRLRAAGHLPAVVYGHGVPSRPITLQTTDFLRMHRAAGASTLFELVVEGQRPVHALVQEVAYDPVSGASIHVDLHAVSMTEEVRVRVPLTFLGAAPAVKEGGGVVVKQLDHVDVEALPDALVHEITVDLTALRTAEDVIRLRDLHVPSGITLRQQPDEIVASIAAVTEEAPAAAPAVAEPAVVGVSAGTATGGEAAGAAPVGKDKPKKQR